MFLHTPTLTLAFVSSSDAFRVCSKLTTVYGFFGHLAAKFEHYCQSTAIANLVYHGTRLRLISFANVGDSYFSVSLITIQTYRAV